MSTEEKKTFHVVRNQGAQGDCLFRRLPALPKGRELVETDDTIVAHSETGHNHALHKVLGDIDPKFKVLNQKLAENAARGVDGVAEAALVSYVVIEQGELDVRHHRDYDTHETLRLDAGVWEVRRQREHTPEGWRQVQD